MVSLFKRDAEKRERRQLQAATIVLIAAAIIILGGGLILLAAQGAGALRFADSVPTTQVEAGVYSNTIECEGAVAPIRVVKIDTKVPGEVSFVAVSDGQYVRQGAVLFEMRDGDAEPQPITASVSGTIMNIKVEQGMTSDEVASLGSAMDIADMNVLVAEVQVPEYVSMLLEDGEYVSMTSSATPGARYQGMLVGLSKDKDVELTSTGQALYDAKIMFDDSGALQVGDPIIARMDVEDYGQVFYVPASSVKEDEGIAYVQIVRHDGTIEQHQVEFLGTGESGQKIIKSDILSSETIVRTDLSG